MGARNNRGIKLTAAQQEAILELGARGSGGDFDPVIMSKLLTMGIVEVRSNDRRLVLTDEGLRHYQRLRATR